MSDHPIQTALNRIRPAVCRRGTANLGDGQLVLRCVGGNDQEAFEALVHRHGPMVLAVCRRLLGNHADAEDAFQATFIVLLRKASTIRPPDMVGNWLHGVAYRAAMKVKTSLARRGARERPMSQLPELATVERGLWDDVLPLLDQEVNRLPAKFRAPIVHCDLEGMTRKDAARRLGWPEGTVAGRLARARAMLARRLTRLGVPVSAGVLTALLAQHVADAAIPPSLFTATLKVAAAAMAGLPSATSVAAIADALVRGLLLARLRYLALALLGFCMLAAGLGAWTTHALSTDLPVPAELHADKHLAAGGNSRAPDHKPIGPDEATQVEVGVPAKPPLDGPQPDAKPLTPLTRLGTLRWRHGEPIDTAALSPDGNWLATAGNSFLRIFDMATGRAVHTLRGHTRRVTALAFSPDNRTVVSSSIDGTLREWDATTGEQKRILVQNVRYTNQAAFSPDGTLLAVGVDADRQGQYLALFDAKTGKEVARLPIDTFSLAFSPDGRYLATTGGYDRRAFLIEVATRRKVCELTARAVTVNVVAFSPDNRTLITDSGHLENQKSRVVTVWDVPTASVRRTLNLSNEARPNDLQFTPDGQTLRSGRSLYNVKTGVESRLPDALGRVIASTADMRLLVGHTGNGAISVWNRTSDKALAVPSEHTGAVMVVAPSPNGKEVVTFGNDGLRAVWDATSGKLLTETRTAANSSSRFAIAGDARSVAVTTQDRKIIVYNVADGKVSAELRKPRGLVRLLALSPDGSRLATARLQGVNKDADPVWVVDIIDPTNEKLVATLQLDHTPRTALAFTPTGKALAVGADDGRVQLFYLATSPPTALAAFTSAAKARVEHIAFAPDGSTIAIAHNTAQVVLCDATTGTEIQRLTQRIGPTVFSPDGKLLAAVDEKRTIIHIHEVATGTEHSSLAGHNPAIRALAFSPDGGQLYSGSDDTTALVWDIAFRNTVR
jgi:RNA polymerase sigma factor (sigma-70 family)